MTRPRLWIIGASSRISRELGILALQADWDLLLAGRNVEELRLCAADWAIRAGEGRRAEIHTAALDLTDPASIAHFGRTYLTACPPTGVFIATGSMPATALSGADPTAFARMTHTNYVGPALLIDLLMPGIGPTPGAFISCLTSVAGDRGRPSNFRYGSTKAAFSTYLQGLGAAAPEGLLIQDVKLGPVDTPMNSGNTRAPFMISPRRAAREIWQAVDQRRPKIYLPGFWFWIMLVVRLLPPWLVRKLRL